MPLPTGWTTEFAYSCLSPDLRRKLTFAATFALFGSVACLSGVTLLVADNDSDPGRAFALARLPSSDRPIIRLGVPEAPVDAARAATVTTVERLGPCHDGVSATGECGTGPAQKPLPAPADVPTAAEASTLHGNAPVGGASETAVLAASTPAPTEDSPASTEAAAAPPQPETPLPQISAPKPQRPAPHQGRRSNDGLSLFAFDQRGRARFRPLFW